MSRSPVRIRQLARKGERGRGRASRCDREGRRFESGSWLAREKEEGVEHPDAIGKVAGSPEGTPVEDSGSWLEREKEEEVEHPDAIGKVTDWIPAVDFKNALFNPHILINFQYPVKRFTNRF